MNSLQNRKRKELTECLCGPAITQTSPRNQVTLITALRVKWVPLWVKKKLKTREKNYLPNVTPNN